MTGTRATWVKICGLRTARDIAAAAGAGADAVGFVFHEDSPRNLAVAAARELQRAVPEGIERVAVFRHPEQALVDAVLEAVRPDWVQTDAEDLARLRLPASQRVLPVLRAGAVSHPLPPRFLFEGPVSGTGELGDWNEAATLARRAELVLAGGLDASNVAAAICRVRPFGVDVSSGVESSRGVKDPSRIREFVSAARAAQTPPASRGIEETRS
jgi:phosphoribosylanthranilate isomerase